jgi:lipopolysaccharide export system protein LptA
MRNIIFSALLASFSLCAAEQVPESGSLSSTNAAYDGQSLMLTGHVVLDHGLGKMMAEEANLQKQEAAGKDFPFAQILLRKDVLLALKNSAEIRCSQAELDFTTLKGLLQAAQGEKVAYTDALKTKKNSPSSPLQLLSREIELNFSKWEPDGKKAEYEVETILATTDVEIHYANNFHLSADKALYRKQISGSQKNASKDFQGVITAYPKDALTQCRLTHEGDIIDADSADLDLLNEKMSLLHPKGILASAIIPHVQQGQLTFQCDHLTWDNPKNKLTLKGNVRIQDDALETIETEDYLEIDQPLVKGKRVLKGIRAHGPTTLTYNDPQRGGYHKVLCHGNAQIDREKLQANLDSPKTDGKVLPHQQLYYEEAELCIRADQAAFEYSVADNTLQPVSLALKGAVRLSSLGTQKPPRCGVADRLNYSLTTRTLILSANPGKKVLFWDESQGARVSANEVHITEDPLTKQQLIRGIGNVQFAFTAEENALLQQLFPQLKINHE